MKFLFTLLVTLFLAAPAWAVDVAMNTDGLLLFEPSDITINKGESVHFVNGMLPPHNIIVDGRIDLSREALLFNPVKPKILNSMRLEIMISFVDITMQQE